MRLRKKKWSPEIYEQFQDYVVQEPTAHVGQWRDVFQKEKIHCEIGSGKGDYWHQMAAQNPDRGFIAIEKDYTASAIALKKIETYPHTNKRMMVLDAEQLDDLFAPNELDVIHLNFSDPWPKTRHEKRRLTHHSKLDLYAKLLAEDGELWLKTDNVGLFNYSLVSVGSHRFELVEVDVDFRAQEQEDPMTEYERKFMGYGQPIFRAVWRLKHE